MTGIMCAIAGMSAGSPPGAPTGVSATAGNGQATISFTPPTDLGIPATITGYRVTSSPGGITTTGSGSPITISGLTNGTAYTFTVAAQNAVGYGPESSASNSVTPAAALYSFTTFTFGTANTIGRYGPSKSALLSSYNTSSNPWLNNTNYYDVISGIQYWTVPETGTYRIAASGASGYTKDITIFSQAALMQGTFSLTQGTVIKILCGQRPYISPTGGTYGYPQYAGGGGGGTFVATNANVPLIVAGGGGGANYANNGPYEGSVDASTSQQPTGTGWSGSGTGGGSGITDSGGCGSNGAGAGGFYSDATLVNSSYQSASAVGRGFVNGGVGGITNDPRICVSVQEGGFGGGGGSGNTGGGGGGYSGGNAGRYQGGYSSGNGGGSYNAGTNQSNSLQNAANGYVTITKL